MFVTFYRQSNGLFVIRKSIRKGNDVEQHEYRYFNEDDADERITDLFLDMCLTNKKCTKNGKEISRGVEKL